MPRRCFALQPLLERSRRIEEACLRDWLSLEREHARCIRMLDSAEGASFEPCGLHATSDWWQTRTAQIARAMGESVRDLQARKSVASVALRTAKLQRGVYEKLEERFLHAERCRRERRERYEYEESNAAAYRSRAGAMPAPR